MTDKQLIETIRNIKEECRNRVRCTECILERPLGFSSNCHIMELIQTLAYDSPCDWDMTKVERIINE